MLISLYFVFTPSTPPGEDKLEYRILTSTHIVSSAYKVYGRPELGFWIAKVILTNNGTAPLYDLKVGYSIDNYAGWSEGGRYRVLLPGSTVVNLYYPVISSEVAKLTSPTPSRVQIKITYTDARGQPKEIAESRPIEILGAHDFIFTSLAPEENFGTFYDLFNNWPLLAAWVTITDPVVREYADLGNKLAGGAAAALSDEGALKSLTGMWSLSVYIGIQYKTPAEAFWTGKLAQYVYYPRDVIRDRSGTCIDTALLFASLAFTQRLKAYIVLMPGHAFTLVELPQSKRIIPIETTALNRRVSFEEAVKAGINTYNEAMKGPHIIIDIAVLQALGVHPPELEPLPPDILEKWGVKLPVQPSPTPSPTSPPTVETYTNPSPKWSISYPKGWTIKKPNPSEVDFYSPEEIELVIAWFEGLTRENVRETVENFLSGKGELKIVKEEETVMARAHNVQAIVVGYTLTINGKTYVVVAIYFEYGGYGFTIIYDFLYMENVQQLMSICNSVIETFSLG